MTDRDPIQMSESELSGMTAELDDMHHDAMPKMYEAVAEWVELRKESSIESLRDLGSFSSSRRGFLAGAGLALGGLVLAACGSSSSKTSTDARPRPRPDRAPAPARARSSPATSRSSAWPPRWRTSPSRTYQGGIDAATAGKLGTVPPAVVTFAQTAQKQHMDHAAAWNAILTSAGKSKVTGVDTTVKTAVVDPAFATCRITRRRSPGWRGLPASGVAVSQRQTNPIRRRHANRRRPAHA